MLRRANLQRHSFHKAHLAGFLDKRTPKGRVDVNGLRFDAGLFRGFDEGFPLRPKPILQPHFNLEGCLRVGGQGFYGFLRKRIQRIAHVKLIFENIFGKLLFAGFKREEGSVRLFVNSPIGIDIRRYPQDAIPGLFDGAIVLGCARRHVKDGARFLVDVVEEQAVGSVAVFFVVGNILGLRRARGPVPIVHKAAAKLDKCGEGVRLPLKLVAPRVRTIRLCNRYATEIYV